MLKRSNFSLDFFLKLLFIPIFFELVIGGGGHYLELGPITVRMLLYVIAVLLSLVYYSIKKTIKTDVFILMFALTTSCLLSGVVGYVNRASIGAILEDFKPLSFIYVLLFFSVVIKRIEDIDKICKIVKIGSLILGGGYILVVLLLFFKQIDFASFYLRQYEIGEVMFRDDTLFFYKGFMYLCVGFFFFLLSKGKYSLIPLLFV